LALTPGTRLGVYEVTAQIGVGGMGEVYRATDSNLKRSVAIKVLPASVAGDADRLARFQREAEVLAALNHPNIAAIYGLERTPDFTALVMELVEGDDLSRRIAKGAIPLDEALPIAKQIADALEAAHEQGIIHRDLKPANIKVRDDGTVKVLDFGLAKAMEPAAGSSPGASQSPTFTTLAVTEAGMILGTVAYMSPEQVRGKTIDKRTDVWAFGCVLFEMLIGGAIFTGDTIPDTIAAILEREPQWRALPAQTPAGIRQLLRRCLDKDPRRRLRDIGDAGIEIDDIQNGSQQDGGVAQVPRGSRRWLAWASTLAVIVLSATAIGVWLLRPTPTPPEVRLDIDTPPTNDRSLALSPDGLKIVFAARSEGQSRLSLRALDSPEARPLPGTERATSPFWSPDNRSIGFFADSRLKRIDIAEGSVRTLASTPAPGGGDWGKGGTIVFSTNPGNPIFRISAGGGEFVAATRFESPQQSAQSFPRFLPDGRHFLFFVTGSPEARGVYLGQLDGLETRRLFDADAPAVYAVTGHLLFIREGKMLAQDFDPNRLEVRGDPFPMAEHVGLGTALSVSAAGPIAYRTPSADSGQRQLVWVDRSGREMEKVVYPDTASQGPSLSRDGRRVAVFRWANGNMDIWSYETGRRTWDRVTVDSGDDIYPLWSPDGTRMVFGSNRNGGRMNLYRKLLGTPPGSEELLLSTSQTKFPMDWSPDGRFLLYDSLDPKQGFDIWALPLEGDRKPFEAVQTDFSERLAQFSPDGTWIAYQSDKTGRFEIYVQPFPGLGGDSRVSVNGGAQVRWNPNGKELFYVAPDDRLMAVPIHFASNGETVEVGTPLGLFTTNVGSGALNTNRQQYMVATNGQSFVMNSVLGEAKTPPITVILNWRPKR
jgi:serine/threonine protein kinase